MMTSYINRPRSGRVSVIHRDSDYPETNAPLDFNRIWNLVYRPLYSPMIPPSMAPQAPQGVSVAILPGSPGFPQYHCGWVMDSFRADGNIDFWLNMPGVEVFCKLAQLGQFWRVGDAFWRTGEIDWWIRERGMEDVEGSINRPIFVDHL
ncbi:hypothetical protein B7494_g5284 [Chlorociboria aeruginascens]|nr:hypothetical protein B7494_g5284 [Chlorociboria aeruginascens]